MPLEDYRQDIERCLRCSYCKHVPYLPLARIDRKFRTVCPSIEKFNFHSWSAGGRLNIAFSLLLKRIEYSPKLINIVYQCQMCGACDISCKNQMDLEVLEALHELRVKCVEDGQFPSVFTSMIEGLRMENNMMQRPKMERGKWAEGLDVKKLPEEEAQVLFHTGCRFSFDKELWPVLKNTIMLLEEAGIDVGILGVDEPCCGGRPYELGFQDDFVKCMTVNITSWKKAGVKKIVTPCSDCYAAFKAWYSRYGHREFEIIHTTEYLSQLIENKKIKFTKEIPLVITYHDPCHLGRLSEPYLYSSPSKPYITSPKKVLGTMLIYDPPKPWRKGAKGIYEAPRNILRNIPGVKFVEMHRIREYSWCCGAGGGVKEAYPDFALWTAKQRILEAKSVGAEAIVTACCWCERNFKDAVKEMDEKIDIYDIVELVQMAMGV
ncbi:MAG: (Fe-S)-binding protein [Candidatus Bathyarchaeia archaeon]